MHFREVSETRRHEEKSATYEVRPRFLASFLSSATVSFSHAFVKRTVETKLRLCDATACRRGTRRAAQCMVDKV